jgi:FkbM family methyltransferase
MDYTKIPTEELKIFAILSKNLNVVFDVGCRDDLDYYNIKPDVEYHLFEPNKTALESIKAKMLQLDKHNIKLNEFGLSDVKADNCVYYSNVEAFKPHWCVPSFDKGDRYSLRKLDDYVSDNNIKAIDMVKVDVEGLDYQVALGGIDTLKSHDKVSYVQLEYSGNILQYVKLLDNFDFYLMVEPRLLEVLNAHNNLGVDFNKSLVKLNDEVIHFIDTKISPTGAGGNIFGINKRITNIDNDLFFNVI